MKTIFFNGNKLLWSVTCIVTDRKMKKGQDHDEREEPFHHNPESSQLSVKCHFSLQVVFQ